MSKAKIIQRLFEAKYGIEAFMERNADFFERYGICANRINDLERQGYDCFRSRTHSMSMCETSRHFSICFGDAVLDTWLTAAEWLTLWRRGFVGKAMPIMPMKSKDCAGCPPRVWVIPERVIYQSTKNIRRLP
ncbi:hypothetical protein CSR02_07660 [Acetobacter pomorum]|uniref:Uncharacterized protein n=1 Tax=Acetobacter pomorum TaxID=65959 RepID=A0A2G4REJ3_9PROT|nr:hypothetical protein [Acetobacter pomorum]PHY94165.1 hypothetical protein CSR02_07660 [Acetobacter pomorum]